MLSVSALMVVLMVASIGGVSADKYVEANVTSSDEWIEDISPYYVNETIYVLKGQTLTIGPGVNVLFGPDASIVVNGTLVVKGNATHKVIFDSKPLEGTWTGLSFNAGSVGNIDHAIINNTLETLRVIDSELTVTNTAIANTTKAVYAEFDVGGSLTIDSCFIDAQPGTGASIALLLSSYSYDDYKNVTTVDITITNNEINSANSEGLLSISRSVEAKDDGIATIVGDILISGNVFNQTSMDSDFIYMDVDLDAYDNATASIEGDFTVVGNKMLQAGDDACYLTIDAWAGNYNSAARMSGNIIIDDNFAENVIYGPYVYLWLASEGHGKVCVTGDVTMNGNKIEGVAYTGFYYWCDIDAEDSSAISFVGDITMNDNEVGFVEYAFTAYWEIDAAMDNATVDISTCLSIENNWVGEADYAFQIGTTMGASWDDFISQDAKVCIQTDISILNNVVEISNEELLMAEFTIKSAVADRASVCISGSLLVKDNQLNCVAGSAISVTRTAWAKDQAEMEVNVEISIMKNEILLDRTSPMDFTAMYFHDRVEACDEAVAAVSGNLIIADNDVADNGPSSDWGRNAHIMYLDRTVNGADNANSTLCGDIWISGNELYIGEAYDCDYLYMEEDLNAKDNATVQVIRDIVMENNELLGSGDDAFYPYISVYVGEENSTATLKGEMRFCNNYLEDAGYGPYICVDIEAEGYGKVIVCQPVFVCGNEVTEVGYFVCYYPEVDHAEDKATVTFDGPLTVSGNTICKVGDEFVYYDADIEAYDEAVVTLDCVLTVKDNIVSEYCYDFVEYHVEVEAYDSANVDAIVPMTVTCNTLVAGGSMVEAEVYVNVRNNATASLCNDVVVQGNSMEGADLGGFKAPAGKGSDGYGLKLFQYVRVIADGVLASGTIESEVLFDGNTIVAEDLVGMNVYRGAHAYGDGADAVACISGDVTATNNDIVIEGSGVGITGGAQTRAGVDQGNASAVVDTLFCIADNEIKMHEGYGIVAIGIDYGQDRDDGVNSSITDLAIEFIIENNCIHMGGDALPPTMPAVDDNVGIYVAVLSYEPGLVVDVVIKGNTIEMYGGTGIKVDNYYDGSTYDDENVGSVVDIIDNEITEAEYGIWIKAGVVCIVSNTIEECGTGIYLDGCVGVVVRDQTFKWNECGIYADRAEETVIEGNAFLENIFGLYLDDDVNTIVRDNFFAKNTQQGLRADGSEGLMLEDCYFYMNGDMDRDVSGGARLTNIDGGVVGNNTFYLNINGGLRILSCVLDMYNGEFDQNGNISLNVNGGSVDWFVDAKAVVHASKVQFAGEIIITGTLVLDDVSRFELRPDNDVPYGIYAGYARLTVAQGGCLEAYNSRLVGSTSPWFFEVYGGMRLFNCVVSDAYEVYLAPSSDVEMTTTTVQYAHSNGIRVDGCSPIIRGCIITGSGMDGIYIVDGARPVIVGCTIVANERGIYAYDACLDLVVDNIIMMNYKAGIYAECVTGTIHDNVLMFNDNELFLIDCDLVVENNQFGYGRLIEMNEPLASALLQAIDDILDLSFQIGGGLRAPSPFDMGLEDMFGEILLASMDGSVGIYAIDSSVEASGNEYGMLQTAVYLVRSDLVFSDIVRTNSFDMTYDNGSRMLSIPFTVYDGIYAVDSTLTIRDAYFQVVDDAIFLENSCALILDTVFDAGDFEVYLFRNAEAAVSGELAKYAILDTSRLYWLATLTINVVDQDSFGIAGASVVVKDASGRVWSEGTTDRHGVFVAYAPYSLETRNGVNDTLGKTFVTTAYGDKATKSAEIDVDGDDELRMKMTIKESSIFGTSPLVLGIVVLVIVAVIVGAVMLARKK